MTGSLGPTSTYATPSPRKSLSKFTDCLARPGQSRRSPHSAAHTALAANTACQASRSLHSAMHATHRGLRGASYASRCSLRGACTRSPAWVLTARRRAGARQHGRGLPLARAPARTSCPLHGACPRRLLPASSPAPPPATSFQPGAAAALQDIAARFQSGAAGRCQPPHPTPPLLP